MKKEKDVQLLQNLKPLHLIQMFHTNCGRQFKNNIIDDALKAFSVHRSLSMEERLQSSVALQPNPCSK